MPKPSVYDELYVGRFLKAGLLKGAKVTLTIKDVDIEELQGEDGKPKMKAILSFVERPMQHVMPRTNAICIKAMFGKELKDWIGKKITLFPGQFNGEECIRVWGSPEIEKDMSVTIELPRRKPFNMTMHAVKAGAKKEPQPAPDPRILTAWELLGWKREEGDADRASKAAEMNDARYLAYLNSLLDEVSTGELAGELVP